MFAVGKKVSENLSGIKFFDSHCRFCALVTALPCYGALEIVVFD